MMRALVDVLAASGLVGIPLALVSFLLGATAWLRYLRLRRGFAGQVSTMVQAMLRDPQHHHAHDGVVAWFICEGAHAVAVHQPALARINALATWASQRLLSWRAALSVLVVTAPLLGLLGTVSGMIETFSALHGGVTSGGGDATVAGGISTALISTQLGLAIGIPGLLLSRSLERMENRRREELFAARALLAQTAEVA